MQKRHFHHRISCANNIRLHRFCIQMHFFILNSTNINFLLTVSSSQAGTALISACVHVCCLLCHSTHLYRALYRKKNYIVIDEGVPSINTDTVLLPRPIRKSHLFMNWTSVVALCFWWSKKESFINHLLMNRTNQLFSLISRKDPQT